MPDNVFTTAMQTLENSKTRQPESEIPSWFLLAITRGIEHLSRLALTMKPRTDIELKDTINAWAVSEWPDRNWDERRDTQLIFEVFRQFGKGQKMPTPGELIPAMGLAVKGDNSRPMDDDRWVYWYVMEDSPWGFREVERNWHPLMPATVKRPPPWAMEGHRRDPNKPGDQS